MEEHRTAPCFRVNRNQLPVKILYFTLYAGFGVLSPYISVYMKQLGLSSSETGIIYGIMPFVTFVVCPLFGMVADKKKRHRLVLIACFVMSGLCYNLVLLVPARDVENGTTVGTVRGSMTCEPDNTYIQQCGDSDTKNCDMDFITLLEHFEDVNSDEFCKFSCKLKHTSTSETKVCFRRENSLDNCLTSWNAKTIKISSNESHTRGQYSLLNATTTKRQNATSWNVTIEHRQNTQRNNSLTGERHPSVYHNGISNPLLQFAIYNITNGIKPNDTYQNNTDSTKTCVRYYLKKNISFESQTFSDLRCPFATSFDCEMTCSRTHQQPCISAVSEKSSTFWLFLALFLVCSVFTTPIPSIVDSIAYNVLGEENREAWGKQRLWGSIAFILFAPSSALIMDFVSKSSTTVDYSWAFYMYLGMAIVSAVITFKIHFSEDIIVGTFFTNVLTLFRYPAIVVFLVLMMFFGMFKAVLEVFLFWHLKNLQSPQIVLGLSLVLNCIPEVIMLRYAGKVVARFGYNVCLCIALLAFALRFFCYSLIQNPWHVLFIEPLHALTFALMYSAATAYACAKAPEGLQGTMQGIRAGFHSGLGKGIGGLVTGKLFDPVSGLGEVWTFRIYAIICFATFVVYAIIQCVFFREDGGLNDTVENVTDNQPEDAEPHNVLLNGVIEGAV